MAHCYECSDDISRLPAPSRPGREPSLCPAPPRCAHHLSASRVVAISLLRSTLGQSSNYSARVRVTLMVGSVGLRPDADVTHLASSPHAGIVCIIPRHRKEVSTVRQMFRKARPRSHNFDYSLFYNGSVYY